MISGIEVVDAQSGKNAAEKMVTQGAAVAIVTLGEGGSVVAERDSDESTRVFHVKAFPVEPVDTTAAGDTYCGCLAVALSEGNSLAHAVRFASAAAALSVQTLGAQPSTPWREAIDTFLDSRCS